MRRAKRLLVVTAAVNGLVLLPFAINVVTGGYLPRLLEPYRWLSWPAMAVFGLIAIFAAVQGVGELPRRLGIRRGLVVPEDRAEATESIRSYVRVRLDQALGQVVHAQLDLETRREAGVAPTEWYVGVPGRLWEPRDDASVIDAYDQFDESLLILGEPGAGKTTMLLQLAEALLVRAGETGPLPVLVELGSRGQRSLAGFAHAGAGESQDFHAWLLGQLQATYHLGRGITETWLKQRGLVLMLDGLDEVAPNMRARCVEEINQLQRRYPRLRIVITSRAQEYDKLRDSLVLRGAILIRLLTAEKVRKYLSDPALMSLRRAVEEDMPCLNCSPLLSGSSSCRWPSSMIHGAFSGP